MGGATAAPPDAGGSTHLSYVAGFHGRSVLEPIRRLARLLAEHDEHAQASQLLELGVDDTSFLTVLRRSGQLCRRGVLLYPGGGELAVSFNGGKDACAVLYLWLAAMLAAKDCLSEDDELDRIGARTAIFFDSTEEFDEVRDFVNWTVKELGLSMATVEEKSFKQGMGDLVVGGLRAVVMGQRRSDPWMADAECFSPSSDGWPPFMRINPILDWSYSHIWTLLRAFGLPYCRLYDEGYTSLGSVSTTLRNPALRRPDGSYSPAHELEDESLERAGRMSRQTSTATKSAAGSQQPAGGQACEEVKESTEHGGEKYEGNATLHAGIVVIGNEILNGSVHESNAQFLCGELHSLGVAVRQVEVVPDDIPAIARAVRRASQECDMVFTSGGLGPTHDDLTMAGVASAFGCRLISNDRFHAMLDGRCSGAKGPNAMACHKMATLPEGCKVEWPEDGNPWPIVSMRNVYIFAGVPVVFRAMFARAARDGRFEGARRWVRATLHLNAVEEDILDALQRTVDAFPQVAIGSYPATDGHIANFDAGANVPALRETAVGCSKSGCAVATAASPFPRLTISFEAFDDEAIKEAREHLVRALPAHVLLAASAAAA